MSLEKQWKTEVFSRPYFIYTELKKIGCKMGSYLPTLSRTLKMCLFSSNSLSKMPLFLIFFAEIFKDFALPVWSSFSQSWYACMYFFGLEAQLGMPYNMIVFFIFLSLKKCVFNTVPYHLKISFVSPGIHNVIFWIESPVRNVLQHGSIFSSFCRNIALLLLSTVLKNYSLMVREQDIPNRWDLVQNNNLTLSLTQPIIHPMSIKWVPRTPGDVVL